MEYLSLRFEIPQEKWGLMLKGLSLPQLQFPCFPFYTEMAMDGLHIQGGEKVVLLWGSSSPPEGLKTAVDQLTQKVGSTGKVQVEHIERLNLCKFSMAYMYLYVFTHCLLQYVQTLKSAAVNMGRLQQYNYLFYKILPVKFFSVLY